MGVAKRRETSAPRHGSMLAAALVLVLGDRSKARVAAVQRVFPLVALVVLVVLLVATLG